VCVCVCVYVCVCLCVVLTFCVIKVKLCDLPVQYMANPGYGK